MRKIESSRERSKLKIFLIAIALSAYPVLIHLSFVLDHTAYVAGIWLAASAVGLAVAIRRRLTSLSFLFGTLLGAGITLWWWGSAVDLIYFPPVLINIALMILFGRTLLPGTTPLVARIAAMWRGHLDQAVASYTRRVTVAWTIFFALMAVESMALALFAPVHIWSLFTNLLNYVFVLLFFVIEYQFRLYCLPDHEHLSFRAFCRLVINTDLKTLAR